MQAGRDEDQKWNGWKGFMKGRVAASSHEERDRKVRVGNSARIGREETEERQ